jgi:hypothetical protein
MWRWLARITAGLSIGVFGLLLLAASLLLLAGAVVFYRMITG